MGGIINFDENLPFGTTRAMIIENENRQLKAQLTVVEGRQNDLLLAQKRMVYEIEKSAEDILKLSQERTALARQNLALREVLEKLTSFVGGPVFDVMSEDSLEQTPGREKHANAVAALALPLPDAAKEVEQQGKERFLMREALSAIADGEGDAIVIARSTLAALKAAKAGGK